MSISAYRLEEFRMVHDVIERMGIASLNQITNATGLQNLKLQRSLSKWVANGRLFRLGKDKYSVTPEEREPTSYEKKRDKLKDQRKDSAMLVNIFNGMVRLRDV